MQQKFCWFFWLIFSSFDTNNEDNYFYIDSKKSLERKENFHC